MDTVLQLANQTMSKYGSCFKVATFSSIMLGEYIKKCLLSDFSMRVNNHNLYIQTLTVCFATTATRNIRTTVSVYYNYVSPLIKFIRKSIQVLFLFFDSYIQNICKYSVSCLKCCGDFILTSLLENYTLPIILNG